MVPEIWSETDNFWSFWTIFCPFAPYAPRKSYFWKNKLCTWRYCNCTNVYQKWQSHDVWFLRYEMQQTEFLVILEYFLPFYPHSNLKNQNFEKLIKRPGDIIISHMCTIDDNHMMYNSWDMKCGGQNFLSFWTIFLSFYYPNNPKIEILKKMKQKSADIIVLHRCTINDNYITYGSWDMKKFLSFWTVFCHFTSVNPKNQNFEKLKKQPEGIIILHMYTINENQMHCS